MCKALGVTAKLWVISIALGSFRYGMEIFWEDMLKFQIILFDIPDNFCKQ